jgi:ATP-dependent Lon protease
VLPIGGVKEKVLGAHRAGIRHIVLPKDNEADLNDVPLEVRADLEFHGVASLDEVLTLALLPAEQARANQEPNASADRNGDTRERPRWLSRPKNG